MTQDSERQRTIDAKIERLRKRTREKPIDPVVRGIIMGLLDLLEDEL